MADRRTPSERAALVGIVTGAAQRVEADHSLNELAGSTETLEPRGEGSQDEPHLSWGIEHSASG